ncbi:MAG TPA: putative toxin-antitoxin system toxin component, PIN family [Thermoanaerobaculia bacterium]|jgi:putative PIN family toxin of toxin-antitoxin system
MTAEPAVIDTNVVVSGLLASLAASPTARILDGMLAGRFRFLLSVELLAEYRTVLVRPKIRRRNGLSPAEVDVLLTEITANGVVPDIESPAGVAPRRGDDHLWRILEASPSALLVTGDRRLAERPRGKARIMTPRAFSALLGG